MVLKCNCEHKDQDQIHGKYLRVMNKTNKSLGSAIIYRCTVCGKEITRT